MSARSVVPDLRKPYPLRRKLGLAAEIVATYARVRWLLHRHELPRVVGALRGAGAGGGTGDPKDDVRVGLRLGRVINRSLAPLPADSRCLVRSLVLVALLARRGIESKLVIGVRSEPRFEAHAWVERGGLPLLPPGNESYSRLTEL